MERGQINLDSSLGCMIYDIVKQDDVRVIFEIGMWNGMGSTRCIEQSIVDSGKKDYLVYSLETDRNMYDKAIKNSMGLENFNLILGTLVTPQDFLNLDEVSDLFFVEHSREIQKGWLKTDVNNCTNVPNVEHLIPESIDLLILDGGEFSTYTEFHKLKDRSRIIVLDDTRTLKCNKIRQEILDDASFEILADALFERNGYLVCLQHMRDKDNEHNSI